jgi:hypothetical protein
MILQVAGEGLQGLVGLALEVVELAQQQRDLGIVGVLEQDLLEFLLGLLELARFQIGRRPA